MPIINHDYKDINFLEHLIVKDDGSPLQGEIDMYRRILRDCANSSYNWHFWHDVNLPIPAKGQSSIQIDFMLVSEKGIVIVEVKGGKISILNGNYYFEKDGNLTNMTRTPFDQAETYMYALINNKVIDKNKIFITTVCAFPHTHMVKTNDNVQMDQGWRLWSAIQQEDQNQSFADYCVKVIEEDKTRKRIYKQDLTTDEVNDAIKSFSYNFSDDDSGSYSNASLESIIEWLQVDNLRLFESLRKNQRLVIEGGPGTGKTTLAKAFIKKHKDLRGLYVCWNKLLESKIRNDLNNESLTNCEVVQFASLLMSLQRKIRNNCISFKDINDGSVEKVDQLLKSYRNSNDFQPYNFIIIDEAQDILDKGAISLLQNCSFFDNGLESGSYMVFYDTEQGYNNRNRQIEGFAKLVSKHSAHFILDENKRVPTNKILLECARSVIENSSPNLNVDEFVQKNANTLNIEVCRGAKSLFKQLDKVRGNYRLHSKECVILAHSSTQHSDLGESLYDRIATSIGIEELSESNITSALKGVPFTSILRFKGLESKHVILVLNSRTYIDSYELYIGITRAIIDLRILILE